MIRVRGIDMNGDDAGIADTNHYGLAVELKVTDVVAVVKKGGGLLEISDYLSPLPLNQLREYLVNNLERHDVVTANIIYCGDKRPRLLHIQHDYDNLDGVGILFLEKDGDDLIKKTISADGKFYSSMRAKGSPLTGSLRNHGTWIHLNRGYFGKSSVMNEQTLTQLQNYREVQDKREGQQPLIRDWEITQIEGDSVAVMITAFRRWLWVCNHYD